MDEKTREYLVKQREIVFQFRQVLTSESDRGCALFAAAYLDVSLSDLLHVSLVTDKEIDKDLFDGTAPLSAFSARIKLAYYLGLISRNCRYDLEIIRRVRNDFAHDPGIISFDTQSIRDRCKNLTFSYQPKDSDPRTQFTGSVMGVLGNIQLAMVSTVPHTEKPNDSPTEKEKEDHRKQMEIIVEEMKKGDIHSSEQQELP